MKPATVALMRHGASHLIRPIVADMGFDIIEPGNFGAPLNKADGPVIVWLRDPRDRMVATLRWWRTKPKKFGIMAEGRPTVDQQIAWLLEVEGLLPEMLRWARIWCLWPGALNSRFEDMCDDPIGEISLIAEHLIVDCDVRVIADKHYGKSRTYTGNHSNWKESFGPLSNEVWAKYGGQELLALMGYE